MDDLNLTLCVLDAGSMAEDTRYEHLDLTARIGAAIVGLQQEGLNVVVVDPKDEHCEKLTELKGLAINPESFLFFPAYNEPTILDTLEMVERYNFPYYVTCFDVDSLIEDWRVPQSTQDWLQKYRQKLEVTFRFDEQGHFHPTWPSQRASVAKALNSDTGASAPATKREVQADGDIVKLCTGWYSDGGEEPQMAVYPHKVHGGLQPVLAILGQSEKDSLLQCAAQLCGGLPLEKTEEEEDFQAFIEGVAGPWSADGLTSHVVSAVGGQLDGLWVVGAGSRKMARRRAAKLALVVAERAGRNSTDNWPGLQRLVERAQRLMEHARVQHARNVESAQWLGIDPPEPIAAPVFPSAAEPAFEQIDV